MELLFREKQEQMIRCGLMKGLHHPETIRLSQELDRLLNEEMAITPFREIHSQRRNHQQSNGSFDGGQSQHI